MVIHRTTPESKEALTEKARLLLCNDIEKAVGFSKVLKKITDSVKYFYNLLHHNK